MVSLNSMFHVSSKMWEHIVWNGAMWKRAAQNTVESNRQK